MARPAGPAGKGQVERQRVHPAVRLWLYGCAGLVFLMFVVGGATRLFEAGLSITEWKVLSGVLPPLTAAQWQAAFDAYKAIPQYAALFPTMTLGDFQFIFAFEWFHRLLARLIGVAFALPLIVFWLKGYVSRALLVPLAGLFLLGGLQGAVGWWMVKSGLTDRIEVSQYRLAVHLLLASVTFAALLWIATGLNAGRPARSRPTFTASLIVLLVFVQIGFGALVAGLRAGRIYNTWPLMDGRLVPPTGDLFAQQPAWSNVFENITEVQFQHRMLAYAILAVVLGYVLTLWRRHAPARELHRATILLLLVVSQAAVGITTLLLVVPIWAALLHQVVAMLVLGMAVIHRRALAAEPDGVRGERTAARWARLGRLTLMPQAPGRGRR